MIHHAHAHPRIIKGMKPLIRDNCSSSSRSSRSARLLPRDVYGRLSQPAVRRDELSGVESLREEVLERERRRDETPRPILGHLRDDASECEERTALLPDALFEGPFWQMNSKARMNRKMTEVIVSPGSDDASVEDIEVGRSGKAGET